MFYPTFTISIQSIFKINKCWLEWDQVFDRDGSPNDCYPFDQTNKLQSSPHLYCIFFTATCFPSTTTSKLKPCNIWTRYVSTPYDTAITLRLFFCFLVSFNYGMVAVKLAHKFREMVSRRSCGTLCNVCKGYGVAMFKICKIPNAKCKLASLIFLYTIRG